MRLSFLLSRAQLKVFSAVCSNLVVFWLVTILATRNLTALILDFVGVILSWQLAVRAEEILEEL